MERPLAICLVLLAVAIVLTALGVGWAAFIALGGGVAAVFMLGWKQGQAEKEPER